MTTHETTTEAVPDPTPTPAPDNSVRGICGHPRHRNNAYHYETGRTYTNHAIQAIHAADHDLHLDAAAHAHIADRILWEYGETCDHDLRDFIAGIANGTDTYLRNRGTTLTHL